MTTTLIIVRHGQTAWNKDERFRGRTDLPLNETGLAQAGAVGRRVAADYRPAAILSSPLQRAVQTAEAVARLLGLTVLPEPGLLDLDYGDFAGLSPAEAEAQFEAIHHTWLSAPHIVAFPHGESLDDVRNRTGELLDRISRTYAGQQVVLVSHVVVCRVLFCSLLGIHNGHFNRFRIDPASLNVFEENQGHFTLIKANDTCHLSSITG